MRILIIGSQGNMGMRYFAICKHLGHEVLGVDLGITAERDDMISCDRAIIATPIDTHGAWCRWCITNKIPFLCEKPISKDLKEIEDIKRGCEGVGVDGRMVCNWKFLGRPIDTIDLDYYNTGKDGAWDYIQPVYLAREFTVSHDSPVYRCKLNNQYWLSQVDFDKSYVLMIESWLFKPSLLWSMDDAIAAHNKLIAWREKNE